MSTIIPVRAGTLPDGVCTLINSEQDRLRLYSQYQYVELATPGGGIANLYISSNSPGDRSSTAAWLRIDNSGYPMRLYRFIAGYWMSMHPLPTGFTMIWTEALPNPLTFDDANTSTTVATLIDGPFWEEVPEMRARFPFGAGTTEASPNGTATTYAVGDTGGHELQTLVAENLPDTITLTATLPGVRPRDFDASGAPLILAPRGSASPPAPSTGPANEDATIGFTNEDGGVGHSTMPPLYTVYFLRRTARLYYRST